MIHITCTNCHATLEIDDAFAGGVCRCQHCGTIQTVPAHLKGNAPAASTADVAAGGGYQQPLYQQGRGGGTGLDELSEAVASSGLARSGLRKPTKSHGHGRTDAGATGAVDYASPKQQKDDRKKPPILWIVLGGVVGLLIALLAFFVFFKSDTPKTAPPNVPVANRPGSGDDEENIVVPKTPNFCGVDLRKATAVVYVLDRGSASAELFDTLKATTYRSLETLGSDKKFAVLFWKTGNAPVTAYPEKGLTAATPANVEAADKAFEDVIAHSRSDPISAIEDAATRGATDVIFVTAKGDDLGDDVVSAIDKAFAGKRVHTFAMGEDFGSVLKAIAQKHNGSYVLLRANQLRAFSRTH